MKATFVATFADGEVTRMSAFCRDGLDWERGKRLAAHAWQTRIRQRRVTPEAKQLLLSYPDNNATYEKDLKHRAWRGELLDRFCESLVEMSTREIVAYHFEVDGAVFHEPKEESATAAA